MSFRAPIFRLALAIPLGLPTPALLFAQQPQTALAFEGVTLIDVTDGTLAPEQTVVVVGNRVKTIGPTKDVRAPKDARVIDARGKYLIPGLWDMHAHTEQIGASVKVQDALYRKMYPQYIANGVTGIREMAQRFPQGADSFRAWQHQVMAGERTGPRAVGPSADLTHKIEIRTADDARRIIDSLKAAGDAFVKYHDSNGDRTLFFAIVREARKIGIPVVGHVPQSVTTVEASDSGLRSIEHVNEIRECAYTVVSLYYPSEIETNCRPLAEAFVRNGTWFAPTLAVFYYYSASESDVKGSQEFVQILHRFGVRKFLAGSDCEPVFQRNVGLNKVCHRGFALLQEVIALQESGLTSLEALQSATLGPAQFFEATDSLGTVAPGKLADLILLDDNPLTNIRNILKIRAVVANGRYFDRPTLDAIDPRGVQLAKLYADGQPDLNLEPPFDDAPAAIER